MRINPNTFNPQTSQNKNHSKNLGKGQKNEKDHGKDKKKVGEAVKIGKVDISKLPPKLQEQIKEGSVVPVMPANAVPVCRDQYRPGSGSGKRSKLGLK